MLQIATSKIHWDSISSYLIDPNVSEERAVFGFASIEPQNRIQLLDWVKMEGDLVDVAYPYHIALSDKARQSIIKHAHDHNLALIEFHSHPLSSFAQFSFSDLSGFDEWVPHVMWRLPERPYIAVVKAVENFDALYWETKGSSPRSELEFHVGDSVLTPTGFTIKGLASNE